MVRVRKGNPAGGLKNHRRVARIESTAKLIALPDERRCGRCHVVKPLDDFYKEKKSFQGRFRVCKECTIKRQKDWRAAHPEREWQRTAKSSFKHLYGITLEEYQELERVQMGVCAICKKPCNRRLCVDHDHETGIVRGLLCRKCNVLIGMANDSQDVLRNALNYLKEGGRYKE